MNEHATERSQPVEVSIPEIEIETMVVKLLRDFHAGKIPLPVEVQLCPIGFEAVGYRAAATRLLKEAYAKRERASTIVIG